MNSYFQLRLDPLGQEDAQEVLSTLLGEKAGATQEAPLQPLKQLILTKTEGNPFFMEEIIKALFDQGVLARDPAGVFLTRAVTDIQIPPTVQGVLAARIDRLRTEEKDLLQTLAVIGKEFSFSLLKRVATTSEEKLRGLLSHLQAEEFIYEQPAFPELEYTFKHALTQEVAYSSLLIEWRRVLHERTAQGFPYWVAGGTFVLGWALVEQGQREEGIAQMRQGIAAWKAMGIERMGQPSVLLAEAYGKVGQAEAGMSLLAEAFAEMQESGEHWWEAELYRIKGEMTLKQSRVQSLASSVQKEAGACFQTAIVIARRQSAKSLELRAAINLGRLWQSQGKRAEARQLLAEIHGWFTEGFDTKDLQEAKALLEELQAG